MATTSIWSIKSRVDNVVRYTTNKEKTKNEFYGEGNREFNSVRQVLMYATNPDKTEKQFFTTGINCEVEKAVDQMQLVKSIFGKEKGILAFYAYQSFCEGEVSPDVAHEIGVKLAEKMWGDRFQVVVSTHLNTNHIHNHFVINSVSFKDGKKYYSNLTNTALWRKTSDEICGEYGLKVLAEKTCKSGINFEKFYRKSLKESDYYKEVKEDLDYAIRNSWSYRDFYKMLNVMGYSYEYRNEKLSVRRKSYKRNIRIERAFGEDYSVEGIRERILKNLEIEPAKVVFYATVLGKGFVCKEHIKNKKKPKGIVALYYYYRYLLKIYPKNNLQYRLTPEMRKESEKLDIYSQEIRFMCKHGIETLNDVEVMKVGKIEKLRKLINERNRLYYRRGKLNNEVEKDEVSKKIIAVSEKIKGIRREIWYCREIADRSLKMIENVKYVEYSRNKNKEQKKVRIIK